MKYAVILIDGAADYKLEKLGWKTPLEYAATPAMDSLVKTSSLGMVNTIPEGMPPGSDVANLSVLGYDPKKYHTGRSPLEAVSLGIKLSDSDIVFRCNLVTLSGDEKYSEKVMIDYSAGEIPTAAAKVLIEEIDHALSTDSIKFYPGTSYRHVMIWKDGDIEFKLTPPHDIPDRKITNYLPEGEKKDILIDLMLKSSSLLTNHPLNLERIAIGERPANSIWLWGQGKKPELSGFYEKFGIKGAVISAVDLVKGIGICAGLEPVEVEGITGNIDTNFKGKAVAAINTLKDGKDFVFIHLEAPDECGHQGNIEKKVRSIEIIDREVIKIFVDNLKFLGTDFRLMILPDHPTPIKIRTHTAEPVPFMIYDSTAPAGNPQEAAVAAAKKFNEFSAQKTGLFIKDGHKLIDHLFNKKQI